MSSDTAEPHNGQKPQAPDPLGLRLVKAREAFYHAFVPTAVVPGPQGMQANFDPMDAMVQAALDRIAVETLLNMLVDSGNVDRRKFFETFAASVESRTESLTKKAGPRIMVPR